MTNTPHQWLAQLCTDLGITMSWETRQKVEDRLEEYVRARVAEAVFRAVRPETNE